MGCDIHFHMEGRHTDQGWVEIPGPMRVCWSCKDDLNQRASCSWCKGTGQCQEEWYEGRNYNLFAILANVRNGYGFAGIPTGLGFKPIAMPKGLPQDVSSSVGDLSQEWSGDGHSHTWHTLQQLLDYDWEQSSILTGVISLEQYAQWQPGTCPDSYCGSVGGHDVHTLEPKDADQLLQGGAILIHDTSVKVVRDPKSGKFESNSLRVNPQFYVQVEWNETYREAAGDNFFDNVFAPMKEFAQQYGGNDKVRIVFWFDN